MVPRNQNVHQVDDVFIVLRDVVQMLDSGDKRAANWSEWKSLQNVFVEIFNNEFTHLHISLSLSDL